MDIFNFNTNKFKEIYNKDYYDLFDAYLYIKKNLEVQKTDKVSDLTWRQGKSYNWAAMIHENITLLIRHYNTHFTFIGNIKDSLFAFTYYTDTSRLSDGESDKRLDDPFIDIDSSIESFFETIKKGHTHLISNSHACKIPDHVEIKIGFIKYDIMSYDLFIFTCEEISNLQVELFAENDMFKIIRQLNPGDKVSNKIIKKICLELKDDYYHGVGILFENETYIKDVYCLTHFYSKEIDELLKEINGN